VYNACAVSAGPDHGEPNLLRRRLALVLRLLAIAVVGACLWFFVRKIAWDELGTSFANAKLWPLAIAAALNFVCLWGKAACWRVMLAPRFTVPTRRLFRYTIAAFAASTLAPARAGEVLRVWTLKRRDGVPVADTAAVAVAEKLLDGVTMLILVAPLPWLLPGLPAWVGRSILLCAGVAVGVFIGLYIAVGRVATAQPSWFSRFIAGMHVVRSPSRLLLAMTLLFLVWAADLGEVMLVLYAVGVHLPIAAGLLILFTLNLAIMMPSTPAQVGALEVGAMAALNLLHVPYEPALAFALLYHALQVLPLIVAGLALEWRLVLGREPVDVTPAAPATTPG
jgi:hypothetical protein